MRLRRLVRGSFLHRMHACGSDSTVQPDNRAWHELSAAAGAAAWRRHRGAPREKWDRGSGGPHEFNADAALFFSEFRVLDQHHRHRPRCLHPSVGGGFARPFRALGISPLSVHGRWGIGRAVPGGPAVRLPSGQSRVPASHRSQAPPDRGPIGRQSRLRCPQRPPQPPLDVSVLLVDDHLVMRNGLSALLEEEDGVAVVGQASNGQEAIEQVEALMPDLVLMDFSMPVMDGVQATVSSMNAGPGSP